MRGYRARMPYQVGEFAAEELMRRGLPRPAVVRALQEELDLSEVEAGYAWQSASIRVAQRTTPVRRVARNRPPRYAAVASQRRSA